MQNITQAINLLREKMVELGLTEKQITDQLGKDGQDYGPRENTVLGLQDLIEEAQRGDETSAGSIDFRILGGQARIYIKMTDGNWELRYMDPENEHMLRKEKE